MLKIYDTKLREKVPFETLKHGEISMYVCGPTVYNYIHIGNARTFVSFDIIRRYLSWRGFKVKFVSNITDVDDKIIKKANEEGRTAAEVAAEYSQAFLDDMHALNVEDPDVRPRATEEIPDMIQLIQELIDGGHAYEVEGDVYFSVRSYSDYGALSGRNIDEMEGGHRELRADGKARGARAVRAGTSSARPCRASTWACRSTFTAVAPTWCSRITRTSARSPRPRAAARSPTTGCTAACCRSTTRK